MPIPAHLIDELVARTDLAALVSDYVKLTPKGGSLWGLCPFHSEKSPSFHVRQDRQVYHCFGCGKGGGAVSFVMELEHLPYVEALHFLARRIGMSLPEFAGDDQKKRERLFALNKEAARYFYSKLQEPDGKIGLQYLKARDLSPNIMTRFGLGYAPDGWSHLIDAMAQLGYEKQELLDAGLAVTGKTGRIYDRFRNRVMFPIMDLRTHVIGFGGRVLDDGVPKYLNSPDTVIFNKSNHLFALNLAKNTKQGRLILTEGYMDTIALHQAGFDCAVASLGTALTTEHAKLISRYTKEIIIAYDADGAGISAAQRAIPLLERTGLSVRVLQIKDAKDPDEYIRKNGRERFAKQLDQSENYIAYRLEQIKQNYTLEEDAQKIEFAHEAAEMIADLPGPAEREVYAGKAARLIGISSDAMMREIKRVSDRKQRQAQKKQERRDLLPTVRVQPKSREMRYENVRSARAEEGILRLIMMDDTLFRSVEDLSEADFSSAYLGKIFMILKNRWKEGRSLEPRMLSDALTNEEVELLIEIMERPSTLETAKEELADYRTTLEKEQAVKAGREDELSLLALQKKYLKKKGMGM
ncbi:MAG: DNA primase [Evtepia sp.]